MSDFTKKNSVTVSIIENRISILNIIPSTLVQIIAEYAVPANRGIHCDREFRDINTSNDAKALVIKRNPNLIFSTFIIHELTPIYLFLFHKNLLILYYKCSDLRS